MSELVEMDGPLASVGLRTSSCPDSDEATSRSGGVWPFVLRVVEAAPDREVPAYRYDPVSQVAVSPDGRPLAPNMAKGWTSYESTHTDGDGGDNETWGWEEVK